MRKTGFLIFTLVLLTGLRGSEVYALLQQTHPLRGQTLGEVHRVESEQAADTAHLECTITEVLPRQVLKVLDAKTERTRFLEIKPTASLRAKNRASFGGRRNLDFEDLAVGQRVNVTYDVNTNAILKVKVLGQAPVPP
jgi:hypothetical protein